MSIVRIMIELTLSSVASDSNTENTRSANLWDFNASKTTIAHFFHSSRLPETEVSSAAVTSVFAAIFSRIFEVSLAPLGEGLPGAESISLPPVGPLPDFFLTLEPPPRFGVPEIMSTSDSSSPDPTGELERDDPVVGLVAPLPRRPRPAPGSVSLTLLSLLFSTPGPLVSSRSVDPSFDASTFLLLLVALEVGGPEDKDIFRSVI